MDHKVGTSSPASPSPDPHPIRAVEYVRMSTEHQQYSTQNQQKVIRQYAEKHGMVVTL